jgi:major vault protein
MILIPPMKYAVIQNPVCLGKDGQPEKTSFGEVKVKLNDIEIRTNQMYPDWFPLYPGEKLENIYDARVIPRNQSLKIEVIREYINEEGKTVYPKDLILVNGPKTFYPRKEHKILSSQSALEITPTKAIILKANRNLVDDEGISRRGGEDWLYTKIGSYLSKSPFIHFVKEVPALKISDTQV